MNEADTCRTLVRPRLEAAGWDGSNNHFFSEQTPFTDSRIIIPGGKPRRLKKKTRGLLTADQYAIAGKAHLSSKAVAFKGILRRLPRLSRVEAVSDFEIVEFNDDIPQPALDQN